jgi:chorismate mutase
MDKLDPIGSWVEEYRVSRLEALFLNVMISVYGKKGTKPDANPVDFMPIWDEELREKLTNAKKQDPEDMKQLLLSIARDQNARMVKKGIKPKPKTK